MPEPGQDRADATRIRAHVAAILASPGFAGSSRLSNFLRNIVDKSLAGKDDEI